MCGLEVFFNSLDVLGLSLAVADVLELLDVLFKSINNGLKLCILFEFLLNLCLLIRNHRENRRELVLWQ